MRKKLYKSILFDLDLKIGKYFTGEVIAIGPKVTGIKLKDKILLSEYSIKNFEGTWKENNIYFIEERFIPATVSGVSGLIHRKVDEKQLEESLNQ